MKFPQRILFVLVIVIVSGTPHITHAARVYFSSQHATLAIGEQQTFDVFLDTEQVSINALNLIIRYPKLTGVTDVSKRGSAISLWVQEPSFTGDSILLSGGIPGGMITGQSLIARFTVQGRAVGYGGIVLDPSSVVLLNDGSGTSASLKTDAMNIEVVPRSPGTSPVTSPKESPIIKTDTRRPTAFQIAIASDPGVFGGKYFASFFSSDSGSGVARYEIREGSGSFQVARSPYLLSDQQKQSVIRIRAYDASGNWREAVWPGVARRLWWWITTIFR